MPSRAAGCTVSSGAKARGRRQGAKAPPKEGETQGARAEGCARVRVRVCGRAAVRAENSGECRMVAREDMRVKWQERATRDVRSMVREGGGRKGGSGSHGEGWVTGGERGNIWAVSCPRQPRLLVPTPPSLLLHAPTKRTPPPDLLLPSYSTCVPRVRTGVSPSALRLAAGRGHKIRLLA